MSWSQDVNPSSQEAGDKGVEKVPGDMFSEVLIINVKINDQYKSSSMEK